MRHDCIIAAEVADELPPEPIRVAVTTAFAYVAGSLGVIFIVAPALRALAARLLH